MPRKDFISDDQEHRPTTIMVFSMKKPVAAGFFVCTASEDYYLINSVIGI
jgi:hypothetical protein